MLVVVVVIVIQALEEQEVLVVAVLAQVGTAVSGIDGTVNTGGGGGGREAATGTGGAGGSGIVIIRFADGQFADVSDMVLQSISTTAVTAPTKGDIVMTYTNGAGTATLNTDLTAEFSADNGSNWTSTTLVAQGSTGAHLIVSAHDVTLTSASGTSMKWRVKTLNQSALQGNSHPGCKSRLVIINNTKRERIINVIFRRRTKI